MMHERLAQSISYELIAKEVKAEVVRAVEQHGEFNSVHEAYAVILEELDEVWEHVKQKRVHRDHEKLRAELVQVAAAAIKAAISFGFEREHE